MDQQAGQPPQHASDATRRAAILERAHGHPVGEREERPFAAAQHAHDLDLARAAARERAGERQRRADRAAEPPRVREQEADRPGLRLAAAAAADEQRQGAEDGTVHRDGERAEQAPLP